MHTPIPATASSYFGSMADSYDSLIRRAVPRYDTMTESLLMYLPASARHVIELGCGTGNLSWQLVSRFPSASFTFVDASAEMIAVTRERVLGMFPGVQHRADFQAVRFEDLDLDARSCDVITSCISLHHVVDKPALYRRLFDALTPGGTFCFADQLRGQTAHAHEINWQGWLAYCRLPGHCTDTEVQSLVDHAHAHDHYAPLEDHFRWLMEAGFVDVDCVWRTLMWGIVSALRPA